MAQTGSMVKSLRERAEMALASSRTSEAEWLLDKLVAMAEGDDALFAHQRLAELRLQRHPWRAALHLRQVLQHVSDEHAPHAMMGLAQALLGNLRSSVSSFQRASRLAPEIPWYAHNLGHILDIALDEPKRALPYLQSAAEQVPEHDEVQASLAHCLARVGEFAEAELYARDAVALNPKSAAHRRLLHWIIKGAPQDEDLPLTHMVFGEDNALDAIVQLLAERTSCFSVEELEDIEAIWRLYSRNVDELRRQRDTYAAALLYCGRYIRDESKLSFKECGSLFLVGAQTVSQAFAHLRDTLNITRRDPRFEALSPDC